MMRQTDPASLAFDGLELDDLLTRVFEAGMPVQQFVSECEGVLTAWLEANHWEPGPVLARPIDHRKLAALYVTTFGVEGLEPGWLGRFQELVKDVPGDALPFFHLLPRSPESQDIQDYLVASIDRLRSLGWTVEDQATRAATKVVYRMVELDAAPYRRTSGEARWGAFTIAPKMIHYGVTPGASYERYVGPSSDLIPTGLALIDLIIGIDPGQEVSLPTQIVLGVGASRAIVTA